MTPTSRRMGHMRLLWCVAIMLFAVACGGEDPYAEREDMPLVGTWLRVHPAGDAADTLRLASDGSAVGSAAGLEDGHERVTAWRIGIPVLPDGFCWTETGQWTCQAYQIRNDTLSLANGKGTTYVRVRSDGRG